MSGGQGLGAETHRGSGRAVEQAANADQADDWRTLDRWGPIVELHVHLEGSMRPNTIRELADANGVELPAALSAGRWSFQDFDDFMVQYGRLACRCLQRPEDFYRVAVEFIDDVTDAGTRYVEVTFTPGGHGRRVGNWEWPLESMLAGLADRGGQRGVTARVILDHSREQPLEVATRTAGLAVAYRDRGVVGLGLGGDERHTAAAFAPAFTLARDHGLASIVHAGVFTGPDSVGDAIDSLGATRVGHASPPSRTEPCWIASRPTAWSWRSARPPTCVRGRPRPDGAPVPRPARGGRPRDDQQRRSDDVPHQRCGRAPAGADDMRPGARRNRGAVGHGGFRGVRARGCPGCTRLDTDHRACPASARERRGSETIGVVVETRIRKSCALLGMGASGAEDEP